MTARRGTALGRRSTYRLVVLLEHMALISVNFLALAISVSTIRHLDEF